jgi:hypothetical protein
MGSDSEQSLRGLPAIALSSPHLVDSLVTLIQEAAKVNALRRVSSDYYEISYDIIVTDDEDNIITDEKLLKMNKDDIIRLYIQNTGEIPFYLSMINIAANNKIVTSSEASKAFFAVGKKSRIARMKLSDLGIDHYKFIASTSFIDLAPFGRLGSDLSEGTRGGDSDNFFSDFINENLEGTRGSKMEETEITIKSIEFDVREK